MIAPPAGVRPRSARAAGWPGQAILGAERADQVGVDGVAVTGGRLASPEPGVTNQCRERVGRLRRREDLTARP